MISNFRFSSRSLCLEFRRVNDLKEFKSPNDLMGSTKKRCPVIMLQMNLDTSKSSIRADEHLLTGLNKRQLILLCFLIKNRYTRDIVLGRAQDLKIPIDSTNIMVLTFDFSVKNVEAINSRVGTSIKVEGFHLSLDASHDVVFHHKTRVQKIKRCYCHEQQQMSHFLRPSSSRKKSGDI